MHEIVGFLLKYGYALLFAVVLAEQIGLPIPAMPVLLAMGALAGAGRFSFMAAALFALVGALISDLIWYQLGRMRGYSILKLICRISLETDTCVNKTKDLFNRFGASSLIFAKFLPGFSTAAPPLAGLTRMPVWQFVAADAAGALLWIAVFLSGGYLFSSELERIANQMAWMGSWVLVIVVAGLAAYVGWKYYQRRRFILSLRSSRITPDELMKLIDSGGEAWIIDLRHSIEFDDESQKVMGAVHFDPEELSIRSHEIPRDREIVLYCT